MPRDYNNVHWCVYLVSTSKNNIAVIENIHT